MKHQDPMKPLDNNEFMGQMTQFALLNEAKAQNEALAGVTECLQDLGVLNTGILESLAYLGGIGNMRHALDLVGRTVKVQVKSGTEVTTVLAVRLKESGPVLETALGEVALPDVLEVYGTVSQAKGGSLP
jgi:flagellar hook assembly protein FlgD